MGMRPNPKKRTGPQLDPLLFCGPAGHHFCPVVPLYRAHLSQNSKRRPRHGCLALWELEYPDRFADCQKSMGLRDVEREEFFDPVSRNVTRERVRLSLEKATAQVVGNEMPRDRDGNVFNGPPDDGLIPQVSRDALPAHTCFPVSGPTWSSGGNPTAPGRAPLSAPPAEPEPRVAETAFSSESQGGFGIHPTACGKYSRRPVYRCFCIQPATPRGLFTTRRSSQRIPVAWMQSMVGSREKR